MSCRTSYIAELELDRNIYKKLLKIYFRWDGTGQDRTGQDRSGHSYSSDWIFQKKRIISLEDVQLDESTENVEEELEKDTKEEKEEKENGKEKEKGRKRRRKRSRKRRRKR